MLTVRGDIKHIERAIKDEPAVAMKAAVNAVNKTLAIARTAGVKHLARAKKLPTKAVKARTKVSRASKRKLSGLLVTLNLGVLIDRLNYRKLGRGGYSAAGRRFPHAFTEPLANVIQRGLDRGSSKVLIYERVLPSTGRAKGRGTSTPNLPIERVKIPLNPEADQIFPGVVDAAMNRDIRRIFDQQLIYQRGLK